MTTRTPRVTLGLVLLLAAGAAAAEPGDWPQWRGPAHDGVSAEASNWPTGWPPQRLWSADVGAGCGCRDEREQHAGDARHPAQAVPTTMRALQGGHR